MVIGSNASEAILFGVVIANELAVNYQHSEELTGKYCEGGKNFSYCCADLSV